VSYAKDGKLKGRIKLFLSPPLQFLFHPWHMPHTKLMAQFPRGEYEKERKCIVDGERHKFLDPAPAMHSSQ